MTDHSGMQVPKDAPVVMASSTTSASTDDVKVTLSEPKAPRPKLAAGDLVELEALLGVEKLAHQRREKFCMEIERRYMLVGMVWDVDFKTGEIVVKGARK